jgi:hypothetical protein
MRQPAVARRLQEIDEACQGWPVLYAMSRPARNARVSSRHTSPPLSDEGFRVEQLACRSARGVAVAKRPRENQVRCTQVVSVGSDPTCFDAEYSMHYGFEGKSFLSVAADARPRRQFGVRHRRVSRESRTDRGRLSNCDLKR